MFWNVRQQGMQQPCFLFMIRAWTVQPRPLATPGGVHEGPGEVSDGLLGVHVGLHKALGGKA
eukprot:4404949-Alexandrium_andersonii.AAC.1